jgi:hypothetical protein
LRVLLGAAFSILEPVQVTNGIRERGSAMVPTTNAKKDISEPEHNMNEAPERHLAE